MSQPQYSQGQMDALARQRGFPDYQTWAAWNAHRSAALHQPMDYSTGGAQPQQQNVLQRLLGMIPWHPAFLFGKTNEAMQNAQNGGQ